MLVRSEEPVGGLCAGWHQPLSFPFWPVVTPSPPTFYYLLHGTTNLITNNPDYWHQTLDLFPPSHGSLEKFSAFSKIALHFFKSEKFSHVSTLTSSVWHLKQVYFVVIKDSSSVAPMNYSREIGDKQKMQTKINSILQSQTKLHWIAPTVNLLKFWKFPSKYKWEIFGPWKKKIGKMNYKAAF